MVWSTGLEEDHQYRPVSDENFRVSDAVPTKMMLLTRTIDPKESTLIIIGLKDRMREP